MCCGSLVVKCHHPWRLTSGFPDLLFFVIKIRPQRRNTRCWGRGECARGERGHADACPTWHPCLGSGWPSASSSGPASVPGVVHGASAGGGVADPHRAAPGARGCG